MRRRAPTALHTAHDRPSCLRLLAERQGGPPGLGDLCALARRCPDHLYTAAGPLPGPAQPRLIDQIRHVYVDENLDAALDRLTYDDLPHWPWELTALYGYRPGEYALALRTAPELYADDGLLPLLLFA
ncbi:hypothetical protein ACFQVC_32275 [Streptomyces monticola]|uniref:Uncharacterized protein n=1 Tax=Streptomyces monticola TaxID=2666263 RepID=A0ABW2JTA0_9ACTN